jgi:hypothetical protein
MDQAFSIKNLKILLAEDREKGGGLEEKYIPNAYEARIKIHKLQKIGSFFRYKLRVGKIGEEVHAKRIARLEPVLVKRKERYEELLNEELGRIAKLVNKKDFRISVTLLPSLVGGKKVYGVGSSLDEILAVRLIQHILKAVYEIKMPSRDILVSQVKSLALDGVPKYIIRADVEQFYESVRHKDLLDVIHQSPELSTVVKRVLTRLIKDYVSVSGADKGLPRGIGVSAYLAEIYLSSVDQEIRKQSDLFYYARYVDDMVLMFAPKREIATHAYLLFLRNLLASKGLSLNSKTICVDAVKEQKGKFEYLGYEFDLSPSGRGVRLSKRKIDKYKSRIDKAFADYAGKSAFIPKKAASELIARALFLTGNMRLFNKKSNAFIGVYFSNKFITEINQIKGLDKYFEHKMKIITSPSLKRRLQKLSFEAGYSNKIFRNFDAKQLADISRGWKHG